MSGLGLKCYTGTGGKEIETLCQGEDEQHCFKSIPVGYGKMINSIKDGYFLFTLASINGLKRPEMLWFLGGLKNML